MRKLLSANFSRLWRDKVFWIGAACAFGFGCWVVLEKYGNTLRYGAFEPLDSRLMDCVACAGGGAALFVSLFLGTDYSDGTIRNKLIVGHRRDAIYLANWVTGVAAALGLAAAYLAPYCGLGAFLLDAPERPTVQIAAFLGTGALAAVAFVSLYTLLSMLLTKKSSAAVLCILLFFGLLILSGLLQSMLDAPESVPEFSMTVDGVEQVEMAPNPQYLQPGARRACQFFLDVLPSGQMIELLFGNVAHPLLLPVYSVVFSAASTALGVFAFRKKDLK